MQHCDGVLLVYNPEQAGHAEQVGNWYDTFVKVNDLDPKSQCLVFAHHSQNGGGMTARWRLFVKADGVCRGRGRNTGGDVQLSRF